MCDAPEITPVVREAPLEGPFSHQKSSEQILSIVAIK